MLRIQSKNLPYSQLHTYEMNKFLMACSSCKQISFFQTLIEVYFLHPNLPINIFFLNKTISIWTSVLRQILIFASFCTHVSTNSKMHFKILFPIQLMKNTCEKKRKKLDINLFSHFGVVNYQIVCFKDLRSSALDTKKNNYNKMFQSFFLMLTYSMDTK